jgi:hypothetical protein
MPPDNLLFPFYHTLPLRRHHTSFFECIEEDALLFCDLYCRTSDKQPEVLILNLDLRSILPKSGFTPQIAGSQSGQPGTLTPVIFHLLLYLDSRGLNAG